MIIWHSKYAQTNLLDFLHISSIFLIYLAGKSENSERLKNLKILETLRKNLEITKKKLKSDFFLSEILKIWKNLEMFETNLNIWKSENMKIWKISKVLKTNLKIWKYEIVSKFLKTIFKMENKIPKSKSQLVFFFFHREFVFYISREIYFKRSFMSKSHFCEFYSHSGYILKFSIFFYYTENPQYFSTHFCLFFVFFSFFPLRYSTFTSDFVTYNNTRTQHTDNTYTNNSEPPLTSNNLTSGIYIYILFFSPNLYVNSWE